jgi:hypothetical protein
MDTNITLLAPYAYPLRGSSVLAEFPRQLRWGASTTAALSA